MNMDAAFVMWNLKFNNPLKKKKAQSVHDAKCLLATG